MPGSPRDRPAERRACYVATTRADAPHRAAISSAASQSPGQLPGPHARPRQSTEGAGAMITPKMLGTLPCRRPYGAAAPPLDRSPLGILAASATADHKRPQARSRSDCCTERPRNSPASLPHNEVRFSGGGCPAPS